MKLRRYKRTILIAEIVIGEFYSRLEIHQRFSNEVMFLIEEHLKDISTKTDGNEMFLCKAARYRSQTKLTRHMTLKLKYILHPKRDDC